MSRFCMLATFYPPYHFGGDAIGIQRLSRALVRAGHEVTVIHDVDAFETLYSGPPREQSEEPEGLEVVPLRSGLGALSVVLTQQFGRPIANGKRIRRLLAEGDFDVIVYHNASLIGGPGLLAYGDALKVYMAHEHWLVCPTHVLWRHGRELCTARECVRCQLSYKRPPQLWRGTGLMDRMAKHVDLFIAMSEFSRDKHAEFGFREKMEVLPYFLPDDAGSAAGAADEPSPHERPYFLFVGRLEPIKGVDEVLPLFEQFEDADFLIAGDGTHSDELRRQVSELSEEAQARIHFLGRVPLDELGRYYRNALALVVPSICYETFGIILIEAFSHGAPVIARRLGPFPEIVERSGGGELFSTADELLAAMVRIANDPEHRDALARRGAAAQMEYWSESAVVPQFLELVRRAAESGGRAQVVDALAEVAQS